MVKLEEVPDEELNAQQQYPKEEEDDWDTDSGTPSPSTISQSHPHTNRVYRRLRSQRRLRRLRPRRIPQRPHRRPRRHHSTRVPQIPLQRHKHRYELGVIRTELFGQGAVGGEHERAAAGCAMGAGVQRGAAVAGDGARDANAEGC